MSDVASRKHDPSPHAFLIFFTTTFPPPQNQSWTLYQFNSKIASKVFSELRHKPSTLASWHRLKQHAGAFGTLGPNGYASISLNTILTSTTQAAPTKQRCWLPLPTMCAQAAFEEPSAKFAPKQSKGRLEPSARCSFWTENKALRDLQKKAILRQSSNSWKATKRPTHPHNQNSPSPSQCPDI